MQANLNELLRDVPPQIARNVARFGVRLAIDLLQTFYADLGEERAEAKPKRGRPPKLSKAAGGNGWPASAEERSREMKRRMAVAKAKKKGAKISTAAKKRWDKKTKAEKETWLRAMQAGKSGNRKAA